MSEEKNSRIPDRKHGLRYHCLRYQFTGYFLHPIRLNPMKKDKTVRFFSLIICAMTMSMDLIMYSDLEMERLYFSLKWQFVGKLVNMQDDVTQGSYSLYGYVFKTAR